MNNRLVVILTGSNDLAIKVKNIAIDYGLNEWGSDEGTFVYIARDWQYIGVNGYSADLYQEKIIVNQESELRHVVNFFESNSFIKEKDMGSFLAVETDCEELFRLVVSLGESMGYVWESKVRRNDGPYVGFRRNNTMGTGTSSCIAQYTKVLDASTQLGEVIEVLKEQQVRSWKIGCSKVTLKNGKLMYGDVEIPHNVVKEIYEAMKE
uniref:Uncharacterized protein n=1 Tax=viral metagenome TaxID=1070528 RepID=A0A6M3KZH8_9ZZZZ